MQVPSLPRSKLGKDRFHTRRRLNSGPNMTYGRNIHPWSNKDQRKDVMLEFFPRDKTCSRWMARMELEDVRFEQNFGSKGWISRFESAPMFLIDSS